MKTILRVLPLLLLLAGSASGQVLFVGDFERPVARSAFPPAGNAFELPPGPLAENLEWIIAELAAGESTTAVEVEARFSPGWLSQIPVQETIDFIDGLRENYPDARLVDPVSITPLRAGAVIEGTRAGAPQGFLRLGVRLSGASGINLFGVGPYFGSVQFPADQNLSLAAAATAFAGLAADTSLLVARVRPEGSCEAVFAADADVLRATGSIFKVWVLGGAADAVAAGAVTLEETVVLVADEIAPNTTLGTEQLGSRYSVLDLARLMLGISDNTATDLLHERVGRAVIDAFVGTSGVADPGVLSPLLKIREQFHLVRSFPLAESLAYVEGSEPFQQSFVEQELAPLGSLVTNSGPFFHASLLTEGTWRASPRDVCRAYASLRRYANGSDAERLVNQALGASAAQPEVRGRWDRVWYKGGSLGSAAGLHVLTHGWLLERSGEDPWVLVAMANDPAGGIESAPVQSLTGRMLELIADGAL